MFDPKDSKTVGYHLFLLPEGALFDNLQKTINALADKYNGAKFEPHVTLLARIPDANESELIEKTKTLAAAMQPFTVVPKTVEGQDAYFRALYAKCEDNPTLMEYHQKALDIFNCQDANQYMPHSSLYYGNISQSVKDEMIQTLSLPADMSFLVDKIYLYKTPGGTETWMRVGEYPVGK